jgi:hypothetical protein
MRLKKRLKTTTLALSLLVGAQVQAFDFDSGSLTSKAKGYSSSIDGASSKISGFKDKYSQYSSGLGFEDFDVNGVNTGFSLECDLPKPSANLDVCKILKDNTGIDIFGQLSRNFNIAGCKGSFGLGAGDELKKLMKSLCNLGQQDAEVSWNVHKIDMEKLLEAEANKKTADKPKVIKDGETEVTLTVVKHSNGQTTETLYKKGGTIAHDTISKGAVPPALRKAYATDDVVTYEAYERTAKMAGSKNGKVNLKTDSRPPETYLQYLSAKQAMIVDNMSLKPSRRVYEGNIREEIVRLKNKHGYNRLSGSSSSALKADNGRKVKAMAKELLTINVAKKNGKDIKSTTEYAKAIKGLVEYETKLFGLEKDTYNRTHSVIVQPSRQKVLLQARKNQARYSDRIVMQLRREIYEEVEFNNKLDVKKEELTRFTRRLFYESLDYKPEIAQKELEELLR